MPRGKISDSDAERMAELLESGLMKVEIARMFGVSRATVDYHCMKLGADFPSGRKVQKRVMNSYTRGGRIVRSFTPDDDARMLEMRMAGSGASVIAKALGRAENSVRVRLLALSLREENMEDVA